MRLRNVKNAFERIDQFEAVVEEPKKYQGHWAEFFGNDHPIHIEIGMGKGQFLIEQAKKNPHINYVGFEKFTVVLVKALEKIEREENLRNLCVVRFDAKDLVEVFAQGEVDLIYLNFSDPWPKERHAKRRLTSSNFLALYEKVLSKEGKMIFKTDNRPLFDFSVTSIEEKGMNIHKVTYDLHASAYIDGNIMTEYETKFHEQGMPIHMIEASFAR